MHNGHRQRMRERIEKNGLDSLADHEVLEYLLYYVQPRVNTNEQAHHLMERFGSFSKVFNANENVLKEIKGIGPQSIGFLTLFPEVCRRYYLDSYRERPNFYSMQSIITYLQEFYFGVKDEAAAIILLDSAFDIITSKFIAAGGPEAVIIRRKDILYEAITKKASYLVLAHNHPSNNALPSGADIELTVNLFHALLVSGIRMLDHVIICPDGNYYSFAKSNKMFIDMGKTADKQSK